MRLRKAIKKIAALGAGVILLGSTVAALDLADYPSPFIDGGKFSGVLAVGDQAAAEDVIGVTDIATSLQFSATTKAGTASGVSTVVEGDAWKVGTSSKIFEMSENLDAGYIGETITNITTSIDKDDLNSLADGEIVNDKGTASYSQYLWFDDVVDDEIASRIVLYTEDDDDVTADFFYIKNGYPVARYELEFKTSFESDLTSDSSGSTASSAGVYLPDIENEEVEILGETYSIVKARRTGTGGTVGVELTLMSGAIRDTLQEGETKTYTIDGKEFEVSVPIITDTGTIYAKLVINGETSKAMQDGDSDKLSDGTEIGVTEILPNEAGDVSQDMVEFYLGAKKLYLKDTDITDVVTSNTLELNNENINDAEVIIKGTNTSTVVKLDSIQVNTSAEDDMYVPAGGKMSELMDEPEALINYDFEYQGLSNVATNKIEVKASGSKQYNLYFTDADGEEVKLPIARANTTGSEIHPGDDDNKLVINSSINVKRKDYFVLTDESEDAGHQNSWALQYLGADKSDADNPVIRFKNLGSGETIERPYTASATVSGSDANIRLGGQTFDIQNTTADVSKNFDIEVEIVGNGALDTEGVVNINSQDGAVITLATTGGAAQGGYGSLAAPYGFSVTIDQVHTDDFEDIAPTNMVFNISGSSGEVRMAEIGGLNLKSPEGESDTSYGYTSYGAFIKFDSPSGDPQTLSIDNPTSQLEPLVYVTSGTVEYSSSGAQEGVESVTIAKIEVGATKLASEVTDVTAQNVLAVGGPCANAVAAEAMGNPADCAAGFEPGKGRILLYENGENVAMVVAGYSAIDTRNAAQVIANYQDYALMGTAMEVSKVGTTLTVAEEQEEVMEEEEPEEEEEEAEE